MSSVKICLTAPEIWQYNKLSYWLLEFCKCGKLRLETEFIKKCKTHPWMSYPFFLYKFILISLYINFSYAFFFLSILYCIDTISRLKNSALKIPFLPGTVVSWSTILLIKLDWMFGYPATSPLPQQPQWFEKVHLTRGLTTSRLHYATNSTPYTTGRIQLSFWRMYNCVNVAQFLFMIWPWMLGNVQAATPRPNERFENANIFIFPSFQETVGSHLKPSLPMVVMATLCDATV